VRVARIPCVRLVGNDCSDGAVCGSPRCERFDGRPAYESKHGGSCNSRQHSSHTSTPVVERTRRIGNDTRRNDSTGRPRATRLRSRWLADCALVRLKPVGRRAQESGASLYHSASVTNSTCVDGRILRVDGLTLLNEETISDQVRVVIGVTGATGKGQSVHTSSGSAWRPAAA
jgi:hypothetical protein